MKPNGDDLSTFQPVRYRVGRNAKHDTDQENNEHIT